MSPLLLHISNDYPDPLNTRKTRAIQNLVEGTPEFRHVVYSLNRYTAWSGIGALPFGNDRTSIAYGALPKGLFWERRLDAVADWILADLRRRGIKPDLVEAHKITVEGPVGEILADAFQCPLVCDIQGDTDVRILRAKIGLRSRLRRIAKRTSLVFPYAPWMIEPFVKTIGLDSQKCRLLPVIAGIDELSPAPFNGNSRLITVLDLNRWKKKNLFGLAKAVQLLLERYPNISLDVYGRGTPPFLPSVWTFLESMQLQNRIKLCGPVENSKLPKLLKSYVAFVMPPFFETYGLVHIEALFAGVPILYSKGCGIDGYLDEKTIGYACNPSSEKDIAKGIAYLLDNEAQLKRSIADLQAAGGLDRFRRDNILQVYREGIQSVLLGR